MLNPNNTYTVNGVKVNEKIIPDGTRWKDVGKAKAAGFVPNALYKKQKKLSNNTGKVKSITIHNTNDLNKVYDDGEQYTRATYNENMNSVRVHFYVDDTCAWQNLKAGTGMSKNDPTGSAEVSWHSGDGSVSDGGNMTSLSIEIIMGENSTNDIKAKDNGARLAAWLLYKHGLGIENLVTHTYWINKSAGKKFTDVDEQCTNLISGRKWCPSYIFASTNKNVALKNWKDFKALVKEYLDALNTKGDKNTALSKIEKGDLVKIDKSAVYYTGSDVPDWVINENWYVLSVLGDRVVIDKNEKQNNSICSPINIKYLTLVKKAVFEPYLVRVNIDDLVIYKQPTTNSSITGHIKDRGIYTIVEQKDEKWGKLKSGMGWIELKHTSIFKR